MSLARNGRVFLRHLLAAIVLVPAFQLFTNGAGAGMLSDAPAYFTSTHTSLAGRAASRQAAVYAAVPPPARYGLSPAPERGKVVASAPLAADAYLELVDPTGGTYANGATVDASLDPNTFILELWLNGSSTDLTGQQSYFTFTNSILNNVNVDQLALDQVSTTVKR